MIYEKGEKYVLRGMLVISLAINYYRKENQMGTA